MKISTKQHYKKFGFYKYQINQNNLKIIRKEFIKTFNQLSLIKTKKNIRNDSDIIRLYKSKNRKVWTSVYDLLKFNINLYNFSGSDFIYEIAKNTGIKYPYFSTKPYVRVDMPNDGKHSFKAHQDYPFNLGSLNSIVIWIPLQQTKIKNGCLKIVPGSHSEKKIFKNNKNLLINDKNLAFEDIECKLGEALVFSQFLIHKSGENSSNKIRFSLQFRVNDLCDKNYAKRYFFINQK